LKVKIMNIEKDELQMEDKELLETITKQNKIETDGDGFHMRIVKRVKRTNEEGSIILELDENIA